LDHHGDFSFNWSGIIKDTLKIMIKETQYKTFDFTIPTLIVGMGGTGLSCARYFEKVNAPYAFSDSRDKPSSLEQVKDNLSPIEILTGDVGFKNSFEDFKNYKQIVVSPGVSIRSELFTLLREQDCFILGDIELFAQLVDKPVIAITGSNGKSTVTTLVEKMAQSCGVKAIAGGNLGIPALELLETKSDLYILELSSFQLETTYSLQTISATVLNISEDHMDRYNDLDDYRNVKESIYNNTENVIVNIDESKLLDVVMKRHEKESFEVISFGDTSIDNQLGFEDQGHDYLLYEKKFLMKGNHQLISKDEIKLKGTFNYLNILAALALLEPLSLDQQQQIKAIKDYKGLPHRCEWVAKVNDVEFYNDSKGTNTGATIAAIDAFELDTDKNYSNRSVILIAGGVGKDADFSELGQVIEKKIKLTVLMGVDSNLIKSSALDAGAKNDSLYSVNSMNEAVSKAKQLACSGDVVLFSPACASFDMYENYMQRGDDFRDTVLALQKELTLKSELKDVS